MNTRAAVFLLSLCTAYSWNPSDSMAAGACDAFRSMYKSLNTLDAASDYIICLEKQVAESSNIQWSELLSKSNGTVINPFVGAPRPGLPNGMENPLYEFLMKNWQDQDNLQQNYLDQYKMESRDSMNSVLGK